MRVGAIAVLLAACATACGSGRAKTASPLDRCVDRMTARATKISNSAASSDQIAEYLRRTYCEPFARKGWVHADGTLGIGAFKAIENGGTCVSSDSSGRTTTTLHCSPNAVTNTLDCALLHFVRRAEVQAYLSSLPLARLLRCDDGTPLDELGA